MENAKVTVIYDEGALEGTTFVGAKGFSLMIDVDGEKTLFGTGMRKNYLSNNLYVAGVETSEIARVVVSHGHIDHWGALPAVFNERNEVVPLYSTASAWGEKKLFGSTGMTFDESNLAHIERHDVSDWVQLSEHLFITAPLGFHDGKGEELFMVLLTGSGPVLMSGCCHCGLDHIFDSVREKFSAYPVAVLGGLHIGERNDRLADLYADYVQKIGCKELYLNHCTCDKGIGRMRVTLGLNGVHEFYVGQSREYPLD